MIDASTVHLVAALVGALALLILALAVFLPQVTQVSNSATNVPSRSTLSSLPARIPISELRDNLIVRRDGSFCAGWECAGLSTQFADAERLEAVSSSLDAFIKGIRHPEIEFQFRYVIDYETQQVVEQRKAQNNCVNSPAAWLEENRTSFWRSAIDSGQLRSIRLLAFLSWKPTHAWETRSAGSRFTTALWQSLAQHGLAKFPAALRNAFKEAGTKALVQRNREEH